MRKLKRNWLGYSIAGLILIGAGISIVGEANLLKMNDEPWFWLGTLGLVVLNSGVSIFGQAVIFRMKYLNEKSNTVDRPA